MSNKKYTIYNHGPHRTFRTARSNRAVFVTPGSYRAVRIARSVSHGSYRVCAIKTVLFRTTLPAGFVVADSVRRIAATHP